jgi:hypothetical protein
VSYLTEPLQLRVVELAARARLGSSNSGAKTFWAELLITADPFSEGRSGIVGELVEPIPQRRQTKLAEAVMLKSSIHL